LAVALLRRRPGAAQAPAIAAAPPRHPLALLHVAGPQTGDGGIVPGRRVRGSRVADADDVLWVCVSLCRVVQGAGCAWTVRSAIYLPIGSARRSTRERGHPAGAAIPPEQREA
jgi:hypothetical protein